MSVRLPSRYEDLDPAFRGRLKPNPELIKLIQQAHSGMLINGGLRFLPLFGKSGSGKSCAVRELATHLPDCRVVELSRAAIQSELELVSAINKARGRRNHPEVVVAVVDQYEEQVAQKGDIPSQFVERLSLLDRGPLKDVGLIVVWLTTSREFQASLADATSRNERILLRRDFELKGPEPADWTDIVEETFEFHNSDQPLADFEILPGDIDAVGEGSSTIGEVIEGVGSLLSSSASALQDLSQYQVMLLWPVTDGLRIQRIQAFTDSRSGYRLNWSAFYRELSSDDRRTLPLPAFNRARLYFDVRVIPIAAADLHPLCRDLKDAEPSLGRSYLARFSESHLVSLLNETWNPDTYSPMRERDSKRAGAARDWYAETTSNPVGLGRRIALCLRELGLDAKHEQDLASTFSSVRADVLVKRTSSAQDNVIIELKAYSAENTMPSAIRDAIRTTLRRHAQFGGFLAKS